MKYIYFCTASLLLFIQSFGQNNNRDWKELNALYYSGKIDDTSYFKKAETLAEKLFKDSTLIEKLEPFKNLAWSKKDYQSYRVKYYAYLTNNATYMHKDGASIYYSEKMEEELKKLTPYMNSLNSTRLKLDIYSDNKTGDNRRITEFDNVVTFLQALPKNISLHKAPAITCINAMSVLKSSNELFTDRRDTVKAVLTLALAENIWNSLKQTTILNEGRMQQCQYMLYRIRFKTKMLMNDVKEAKNNLDSAFSFITSPTTIQTMAWRKTAIRLTALKFVDFFSSQKKYDSAEYYLQISKNQQNTPGVEIGDGDTYLLSYGKLKAAEGYYDSAYKSIFRVNEIKDSVIGLKIADINNNMYAQLIAEQNNKELKKVEIQKKERNILIVVISFISVISLLLLYWRMRKKELEAKERIYKLNFASQLQIMELEEKQHFIKEEEQKKIGMDLHDNLANTIATMKFKIEAEMHNNGDSNQVERLESLRNITAAAYESVRNKSHKLYQGLENEHEIPFSKRIKLIAENSFPANKYKTDITVDDESLKNVSLDIKIEILHIIQEAITNILKHAKASMVAILIYEDISGVVVHITDNGKGFDTKIKKKGIGLNSIRDRVTGINGNIDIKSNNTGTEINVTIPVTT